MKGRSVMLHAPSRKKSTDDPKSSLAKSYQTKLKKAAADFFPNQSALVIQPKPSTNILARAWRGFLTYIDFMTVLKKNAFLERVYSLTLDYHRELNQLEMQKTEEAPPQEEADNHFFQMKQLALKHPGAIIVGRMIIPLEKDNQQFADQLTLRIIQRTIDHSRSFLVTGDVNSNIEAISQLIRKLMNADQIKTLPHSQGMDKPSEIVPIGENFAEHILSAVSKAEQNALIIELDKTKTEHHSLGVVADNDGIWFIDSHQYVVRLPKNEFSAFFTEYLMKNYLNYQQAEIYVVGQKPHHKVQYSETDERRRPSVFFRDPSRPSVSNDPEENISAKPDPKKPKTK